MARTRWYLNEELNAYPFTGPRSARAREFPNDAATRWGHNSFATAAEAHEYADHWADYLDGTITQCEFEFGPHTNHQDCKTILAYMSDDSMPDERFNEVDEFGQTGWVN